MLTSAGLLMFRVNAGALQVLLVHPGGPFCAKKDAGVWTIPKGMPEEGEELLECARREFREETGFDAGDGPFLPLSTVKQKGGKVVHAWAMQGDCDPAQLKSNTFSLEWPPRSGKMADFPEIDRAAWFGVEEARRRILKGQLGFIEHLVALVIE